MGKVEFAKYQKGEEVAIFKLIKKVYDEFVACDYSEEGNRFFYDWIDPLKMAERQKNERNIWVAKDLDEITGMIEIRDNNRISLLFVDKEYQQQGIASKLFSIALESCMKKDSELNLFYVHASPFSMPIYKRMGFVETDKMQEKMGIKFLPMEMKINL